MLKAKNSKPQHNFFYDFLLLFCLWVQKKSWYNFTIKADNSKRPVPYEPQEIGPLHSGMHLRWLAKIDCAKTFSGKKHFLISDPEKVILCMH